MTDTIVTKRPCMCGHSYDQHEDSGRCKVAACSYAYCYDTDDTLNRHSALLFSKIYTAGGLKYHSVYTGATLTNLRDVKKYAYLKGAIEFTVSESKGRTRYIIDHGEWTRFA